MSKSPDLLSIAAVAAYLVGTLIVTKLTFKCSKLNIQYLLFKKTFFEGATEIRIDTRTSSIYLQEKDKIRFFCQIVVILMLIYVVL